MRNRISITLILIFTLQLVAFPSSNTEKVSNRSWQAVEKFKKGTYGYDLVFLKAHKLNYIELKAKGSKASLILSPGLQGRVLTSSAEGNDGKSFGWLNYKFIESGVVSSQFNPYGGEERLWFGPEGGPFSIYFPKGKEQVYANWKVPAEIDTKPFEIVAQTSGSVTFRKEFNFANAAGTTLKLGVQRKVKLLTHADAEKALKLSLDKSLKFVAYESENILTNLGKSAWTEKTGFLSVWLLSMFNPSEKGVVFIPFKEGSETGLGKIVTDDYFGKVPSDRLLVKNGVVFFKTDGKHRSKIGISPQRALPYCGSYDPINHTLTLLWFSKPAKPAKYVNSKWGKQDNPLSGDAVNSYNDGPVDDGSIMGPFYEIESSSAAAMLIPGESIRHRQRIFHISGDEKQLSLITQKLFNISVLTIREAFK